MNLTGSLLADQTVYAPGSDPVSRLIAQHLSRMGATLAARSEGADITISDSPSHNAAGIVCQLEDFNLDNGELVRSETTAQAALGLPDFIGASGERPDRTGVDVASSVAAFLATQTILAVKFGSPDNAAGVSFTTSPVRALALLKSLCFAARSRPDEWVGTHVRSREKGEDSGYKTADGRITLDFREDCEGAWRTYCQALGVPLAFVETHAASYMETVGWGDNLDLARPVFEEGLSRQTTEEAIAMIIASGGSSVPFQSVEECLAHPQAMAVGLAESFETGLPFRLDVRGDRPPPTRAARSAQPGQPLHEVRVVDLGIGGVGPFAPMILGRLGADVVKIEPPYDFVHSIGPWTDDLSTTYLACNAAKRSLSLNLKRKADRDVLLEMVAEADVVNANFRPGALERLGVGFDDLISVNANIVLATTTGFGWAGPMSDQPCTDPHAQAFAGFADRNARAPSNKPRRCRYVGFIDVVTSTVIAEGICAALLTRDAHGGAVHTQTSMMHAVCETAQTTLDSTPPKAPDDLYRAADGYFALTCQDEADWQILVAALDDPTPVLAPDYSTPALRHSNRNKLRDVLEREFNTKAALAWVLHLARAGVPAVRLIDDDEALARIDYRREGLVTELHFGTGSPILVGGNHAVFASAGPPGPLRAPTPGEDDTSYQADPSLLWRSELASVDEIQQHAATDKVSIPTRRRRPYL